MNTNISTQISEVNSNTGSGALVEQLQHENPSIFHISVKALYLI